MKGLLMKDIKLLSEQKRFFLIVVVIGAMLLISNDDLYFPVAYITILFALFTASTVSYDEFDNGMPFLMTLPVSRKMYVGEKYVFGFLISVVAWLFAVATTVVCMTAKQTMENPLEFIGGSVAILAVAMLFLALMLPPVLKYGMEKGRMAMFAIGGGVALAGIFIAWLDKQFHFIEAILPHFSRLNPWMLTAGGVILLVAALAASYLIAVRAVEKKEY